MLDDVLICFLFKIRSQPHDLLSSLVCMEVKIDHGLVLRVKCGCQDEMNQCLASIQ